LQIDHRNRILVRIEFLPDEAQPPEQSEEAPEVERLDSAAMTGEELAEAKRYGRYDLVCTLADKGLDLAYLAIVAMLLARHIDGWLESGFPLLKAYWSLRLSVLFLIVTGAHACVSFPLSFYSGHVLEHRFGLSTQTIAAWLWRYAKRIALATGFGLVLIVGLYWVIWTVGPLWWLVAAGAFFLVSVLLGQLAPVLILPLFYKIEKLDDPELSQRLARLAQGTGLSIEGVYRIRLSEETIKANAMLAGLGRTRRVLLSDTLLSSFTPEEIEVVFAHEIGHHVFRHIYKLIAAGIFFSAAGFWICDRLLTTLVTDWDGDYGALPVATLPLVMLILTAFAMLLEPLQNLISRRYERQSDRYALERTGLKDAYTSAFRKLARLNKDDPSPHWLDVLLFHSHPPVDQRLAIAEQAADGAQ
jgi:STE24 endopeptidase